MRFTLNPTMDVPNEWRIDSKSTITLDEKIGLSIQFRHTVPLDALSFKRGRDRFGINFIKVKIGRRHVTIQPISNQDNTDLLTHVPVVLHSLRGRAASTRIILCLRDPVILLGQNQINQIQLENPPNVQ